MLICEISVILVVLNAGSYFSTTTYTKSIDLLGIILTVFLLFWILVNGKIRGYERPDLGLCFRSISQKQWKAIVGFVVVFYPLMFAIETLFPSEIRGDVTFIKLVSTAVFTLAFGPIFEELLFRGYLFTRSQDVFHKKNVGSPSFEVSSASIVSGIAWGLWHLPTPIVLWYFNDPLIVIYQSLFGFVLLASIAGILLGEVRRRTESLLPGIVLHLVGNSAYVLTVAMRIS